VAGFPLLVFSGSFNATVNSRPGLRSSGPGFFLPPSRTTPRRLLGPTLLLRGIRLDHPIPPFPLLVSPAAPFAGCLQKKMYFLNDLLIGASGPLQHRCFPPFDEGVS